MRNTSAEAIQSGRESRIEKRAGLPAEKNRQLVRAVQILKAHASEGVYRQRFLIPVELGGFGISQIATRLFKVRRDYGCVIDSRRVHPGDAFVTYFWRSEPPNIEELLSNPDKETDWYERAAGRKRPTGQSFGPLFDAAETSP